MSNPCENIACPIAWSSIPKLVVKTIRPSTTFRIVASRLITSGSRLTSTITLRVDSAPFRCSTSIVIMTCSLLHAQVLPLASCVDLRDGGVAPTNYARPHRLFVVDNEPRYPPDRHMIDYEP